MLLSIIEELQPEYMGVFFDRKAATYRHELFEEYKANRETMPDELVGQLVSLKQLVRSLGIVTCEKDGFEADDFIGIYSEAARLQGVPCIVYSGDNDLLQLTDDNTSVRITVKGVKQIREYTPATILQEFGLTAPQLVDVKALMGDTSDNIPGVRGIGEKTALKLIQEFGSVQDLLEKGGPERYTALLAENRDLILRNRSLVTIRRELDEATQLTDLQRLAPDADQSSRLFESLSFANLARRASRVLGIPLPSAVPAATLHDELFAQDPVARPVSTRPLIDEETAADNRVAMTVVPDAKFLLVTRGRHVWLQRRGSSDRRQSDDVRLRLQELLPHADQLRRRHPHACPRHHACSVPSRSRSESLGSRPYRSGVEHHCRHFDSRGARRSRLSSLVPR
jgi:5'-3' exonuclease